jgi:hypothetical protein
VARLLEGDSQSTARLGQTLDRYGAEIQYLATRDPEGFLAVLDAPAADTAEGTAARRSASSQFLRRASSSLQAAGR